MRRVFPKDQAVCWVEVGEQERGRTVIVTLLLSRFGHAPTATLLTLPHRDLFVDISISSDNGGVPQRKATC